MPIEDDINNDNTKDILKKYTWADKYMPRKPKYYNSVKTGFEWNKYN